MTRARPPRPAPVTLPGSLVAKQRAVVLLEVLSGACGIADALSRLGVSATHYYAFERRALQAMLQALEPKPRGHQARADPREQRRASEEVLRLQALVRATQRAVSLVPAPKPKGRRRKSAPRARKVIAQLRLATPEETPPPREE